MNLLFCQNDLIVYTQWRYKHRGSIEAKRRVCSSYKRLTSVSYIIRWLVRFMCVSVKGKSDNEKSLILDEPWQSILSIPYHVGSSVREWSSSCSGFWWNDWLTVVQSVEWINWGNWQIFIFFFFIFVLLYTLQIIIDLMRNKWDSDLPVNWNYISKKFLRAYGRID